MIILINGAKRSGKDFSAKLLKTKLSNNKTVSIMSFADPIKQIIADTFNITLEGLNNYKNLAEPIYVNNGGQYEEISDFRTIIQRFGNEAMKKMFSETIWSDLLLQKAKDCGSDIIIVPDFRFNTEIDTIKKSGFKVVTLKIKNDKAQNTDSHNSERELDNFKFDYTIDNSNYSDELEEYLDTFINLKLKLK